MTKKTSKSKAKTAAKKPMVKILKADELRKKVVATEKDNDRYLDRWIKRSSAEKDKTKQNMIDRKSKRVLREKEQQCDDAYDSYYHYVEKNFQKNKVQKAMKVSKDFMSKKFINHLAKM